MNVYLLERDPAKQQALDAGAITADGQLRVMPASFYAAFEQEVLSGFAVRHGLYNLVTQELVDCLRGLMIGKTIEIGAGNGVMAGALGIIATDNRMQEWPHIKIHYENILQPCVRYGKNIVKLDALEAIHRYKPDTVIAAWVTHLYNPNRHTDGGNAYGVDEKKLLKSVRRYIFIGNEQVHALKPIWKRPHVKQYHPWLYSRAGNGSPNFIAIFEGKKHGH